MPRAYVNVVALLVDPLLLWLIGSVYPPPWLLFLDGVLDMHCPLVLGSLLNEYDALRSIPEMSVER